MFAAMAGVLFAGINQYIDPTILHWRIHLGPFMLIVGGAGNFRGPCWGAH